MNQNATTPNNSHSESSHNGKFQYNNDTKIAAMLYREHISELEVWAQMFDDRFQLGELPSAALIGIIKDMETDYDLNLVAMTLDESIKETLTRIAYENDFPSRSHLTDRVEHMVKLARILRFINRDIMPYTKI